MLYGSAKSKVKLPKSKTIKLSSVGRSVGEIQKFGTQLISNIGDGIFYIHTKQLLAFHLLKQITPINRTIKLNDESIERACEKIVKHFRMEKFSVRLVTRRGIPVEENFTTKFFYRIVSIEKLPSETFEQISRDVNSDLNKISILIGKYEQHFCILKYIKNGEIPKSHADRIIFDFYKRCIQERIEILSFLLNKVKPTALRKARQITDDWISFWGASAWFNYDRTYHFSRPNSINYFDCTKIDLASHRVGEFYTDEEKEMKELYNSNKTLFYSKYFKRVPVLQHFQIFDFYLPHLPLKNNRKPIFQELKRLFKARRWISFYALALPQVEGLFSEMCVAVSPKKDLSQKSLTYKVDLLRPYHAQSNSYFDYYQYHIPTQRNKFSHIGYDDDFKIKSYDLLVDLSHLLKIFFELDNPLVDEVDKATLTVKRKPPLYGW